MGGIECTGAFKVATNAACHPAAGAAPNPAPRAIAAATTTAAWAPVTTTASAGYPEEGAESIGPITPHNSIPWGVAARNLETMVLSLVATPAGNFRRFFRRSVMRSGPFGSWTGHQSIQDAGITGVHPWHLRCIVADRDKNASEEP